jgi:hypothetical protein
MAIQQDNSDAQTKRPGICYAERMTGAEIMNEING